MMQLSTGWEFPTARLLVIDDNEQNLLVAGELLKFAGYMYVKTLQNARDAVDTIFSYKPDLVLLDLHMPHVSGHEILSQVCARSSSDTFLPILVFTADSGSDAKKRALDLGASDFITKPFDGMELLLRVRNFLRMRQMHLALHNAKADLEERVRIRTQDMVLARAEGLECLARAIEYRDDDTGGHTRRVGKMSGEIATAIGLSSETVETISLAAPLHDLGKIGISDALLLKPGRYTPDEFETMKQHTLVGETIIGGCESPVLKLVREIALHHHEKWDGTGYPHGLKGEEIPISCRIVAIADVYDALTNERPYKKAWTHDEAVSEILKLSGTHFDPKVVTAFIGIYS